MEPIFFNPVFQERLWGGSNLEKLFGYKMPHNKTGEGWGISAHPNGESIVAAGNLLGTPLSLLWDKHPSIFGNENSPIEPFPYLVKVIDSGQDLSIQVHPNDIQARMLENYSMGKNECWYILDCAPDAEIILGHNAKSPEELEQMVTAGDWAKLLRRHKVQPGQFYNVPSGTLHAIGQHIQILEIQQNSDITYRVYDYDRKDDAGHARELHTTKALQVINTPHDDHLTNIVTTTKNGVTITEWDSVLPCQIQKITLQKECTLPIVAQKFIMGFTISGNNITINGSQSIAGDFFILPGASDYDIAGDGDIILAYI